MAIFFTADSHFCLNDIKGAIQRDFRPFKSLPEMNESIIKLWNMQANREDIIYHIGDFVNFNRVDVESYKECFKLVQKINAKVVLILGNNEKRLLEQRFGGDFEEFRAYLKDFGFYEVYEHDLTLKLRDKEFYLTHKPTDHKEGVETLFGHVHGCCFVKKYGFNVGVDCHYLSLFSEDDIFSLIENRKMYDDNIYN